MGDFGENWSGRRGSEATALYPLPAFAWMVPQLARHRPALQDAQ